ncbi:malto-oligosyltrehalose synthase [Pigmentiphaga sp. NML080357]|uniref:malto-oligosyltrehalose synthase n=1 Tax=Pigmentiphaga sp. NML080357 TaxID=2008675 RepID=UPI000B41CE6F|nr:malto-oligosyltrehalose synthase [Pigmentiphaga sp. NML080357]OVZ55865.1 malto-oligosyltrehalose synthase [Pigmentiphaga sp. NML080357]
MTRPAASRRSAPSAAVAPGVPRATARLQFHAGFPFEAAIEQVDYFDALGVSHIYASPITRARPGSMHGYDTVDYETVSPELGGEEGLRRLVERLRAHGMGLIIDVVPNHMGVSPHNAWWWSVLRLGRRSPYAEFFDIDWEPADAALCGKVLAPFLGDQYGQVLAAGQLSLQRDDETGEYVIAYFDARFPVAPEFSDEIAAQPPDAYDASQLQGRARLHALLERQHYRLAWWRTAAEEINWRRFFEISDLIGVRVERDDTREAIHRLPFRLYAEGLIDGIRVDHIDGLADPEGYCRYLRENLTALNPQRPAGCPRDVPYIVVEKILAADEHLPASWRVHGTTGYDFMNEVGALLHDPQGEPRLTSLWQSVSGESRGFRSLVLEVRRKLVAQNFAGECDALVCVLHRIARADLGTRDWGPPAIRRVLTELLVHFPVYRTYVGGTSPLAADEVAMSIACKGARQALRRADLGLLELLAQWLGHAPDPATTPALRTWRREAIRRFQQLTAPLAAKSVEDTGFYRYGRLLSRNEVGGDPGMFSLDLEGFHRKVLARAARLPDAMLATATHDHKRGEDTRARLAVLSELGDEWQRQVEVWMRRHEALKAKEGPRPAAADEYMLYQTLFGVWPLDLFIGDEAGVASLAERVAEWQTKSLREAKLRSSWVTPADEYEQACEAFLRAVLDPRRNGRTLLELSAFVARAGAAGALNSLVQALLRLTTPGVPDLYQGTEFWDFSLVDPDNRRPVDYERRRAALRGAADNADLIARWRDGCIKFELIRRVLALRRRDPELFRRGDYLPLAVRGDAEGAVLAYVRRYQDRIALVVAPHCAAALVLAASGSSPVPHVPPQAWGDTAIDVSGLAVGDALRNALGGPDCSVEGGAVRVSEALAAFPVALMYA